MLNIHYWPEADRLVYLAKSATPQFWDELWIEEGEPPPHNPNDFVVTVTRAYLPRGARVLEGGCGRGNKVNTIARSGFDVVGLDFAENTVRKARERYPEQTFVQGDVRSLGFEDGVFDGYWSLGVIEHFWNGYDDILSEAARVVRPNGFLFLTAPWFSPYRRRLAAAGSFPYLSAGDEPAGFYQFALGKSEIATALRGHGFSLKRWTGMGSELVMQEDGFAWSERFRWLYGSRGSLPKRVLRKVVSKVTAGYFGHSFLAVAQRNA